MLPLIVSLGIIDDSAVPGRVQEAFYSNQSEPTTAEENIFDQQKSDASATTKLFTSQPADAFGRLESVGGILRFILENCEVWSFPIYASATLIGVLANESE